MSDGGISNRLRSSTARFGPLAVLDRNLFEIPPSEMSDTKVLVTVFEGKAVHGDLGAL